VLAQPATPLTVGESLARDIHGQQTYSFSIAADGELLVTVENLGRDTILTVFDTEGSQLLRSATWRGTEGLYRAVVPAGDALLLQVTSDEAIAPHGQFRISTRLIDRTDPDYEAELAMGAGADLRLRHHTRQADTRQAALEQFHFAAARFEANGNTPRHADALYEAADACLALRQHRRAMELYAEAEALWTELGDIRGIAAARNMRGLLSWYLNEPRAAIQLFTEAAELRAALGDELFLAKALNNTGLVYREIGDTRAAIPYLRDALHYLQGSIPDILTTDAQDLDFDSLEVPPLLYDAATTIHNLGWSYEVLADVNQAERILEQGLALSHFLDNKSVEAKLRSTLGRVKYRFGDLQAALEYLDEALTYFTEVQRDEIWESHVRQNKALVYLAANANERAELELEKALQLRSVDVDPVGHADTLAQLADLALKTGNLERAGEFVERALEILGGDTTYARTKAELHDIAARLLRISGSYPAAKERHGHAMALYETAAYTRGLAEAKTEYATTLAESGEVDTALAELNSALALAEQVADRLLQFKIAVSRGRIQLSTGNPDVALEYGASALSMSEDIRDTIVDPRLLREFAARQREAADVVVGAAITRHDLRNEVAWRTADDARARYFAASLRQPGLDQSRLDEEQQALYRSLLLMRAARVEERSELLSMGKSSEASAIDDELTEIVDQIELLQSRARGPVAATPLTVSVDNLQARLGPGEVVLEYYFGAFSSGVWRIRPDDIAYVELPPLDAISPVLESVLASAHTLSTRRNEELLELSQTLLGSLDHAGGEAAHIIVVADGPLHYLPFSMLLDPGTNYERPLVESRGVSYLPSVRSLLELESRQTIQGKGIAVLADPVFTRNDERVGKDRKTGNDGASEALDPLLLQSAAREFPRLAETRKEAAHIVAAAGDTGVTTLLGFDANRDAVTGGGLNDFDVVHFATHGKLDPAEPALSGLILSGLSETGEYRSMFLPSQDVATLQLRASLVVMSACDTGSGRIIHGEGLVGLSRAFFYAGARQVVSSLWRVPDQSTAELMGYFYEEMLSNGHDATSALRLAKVRLQKNRRWRNPYFWAPFVVQGSWQ
jgi:CHAT domain-containing protein/tetratricopeptide (TPR) repeat protein